MIAAGVSETYILNKVVFEGFHYIQDWTSTVAWLGAASLVISVVLICAMFCFTPIDDEKKNEDELYNMNTFSYIPSQDRMFFELGKPTSSSSNTREEGSGSTSINQPISVLPLDPTNSLAVAMYSV